ncbi:hypothetical protein IPL68_03930 [Candidatus Saccharibacteria bacterium]|nr:MAG: hypothetical protein IPL68_03930 [Candidatus Saccharibacteria bacterium]
MLSWSMLAVPFILSFIDVRIAALFMFIYVLINFSRGSASAIRSMQGFRTLRQHQKLPWLTMLEELAAGEVTLRAKRPRWHHYAVAGTKERPILMKPSKVVHAVIIATYKESRDVLQPTIEALLASDYNMKQVICILAYEGRAGRRLNSRRQTL